MQIDCTVEVDLCRDHHITGFPSLRVFRKGHDEVMNHGLREHESYKGNLPGQVLQPQLENWLLLRTTCCKCSSETDTRMRMQ